MKHRSLVELVGRVAVGGALAFSVAGCTDGMKEKIREHDFRAGHAQHNRPAAAVPSPVADVEDMNGWTTDFDGALAFARENGRRIALFVYRDGEPVSERGKKALNSSQVSMKAEGMERVAVEVQKNPQVAARYGANRIPGLYVLDSSGSVVSQKQGALSPAMAAEVMGQ